MKSVLIEVRGGSAEILRAPKGVTVEIIDFDLLREGDLDDIRRHWADDLSPSARAYVRRRYPKLFEFVTTECAD